MLQVEEKAGVVIFSIKAQPRSSKSTVAGEHGGSVKVNAGGNPESE